MKKVILFLLITVSTMLSTVWAYDFSAVVPSGQTLYFNIHWNRVSVTYPGSSLSPYSGYTKPSGILVIPSSITHNGTTYSVTTIDDYAFRDCSSLTSVTIGNSVTIIGYSAFKYCSSLTSVTIPNSVTTIGSSAFYGCSSLTSVTIPNSVTSIGEGAFNSCSGLTSFTIPNSVTTIGSSAFQDCNNLATLNFNATNCSSFSSYYHPFNGCPISTINIGDSVQRIPAYFAYNLDSLSSITIPNSVTSIGSSAFSGCSSLTSVTIPNSVTSIGYDAFYNCSGLTSVTIPNSVTSIGSSAFANCTGLTSVTIGNSVTSIGNSAFSDCNNLRDVTSLAVTPPTLGTTVFSVAGILKVPCGSLSAYRYSAWLDYFTIMEEICDNITITVTSANENMGTVSGGGEYAFGTQATITATPNQGYRFVSWNDGNTDNPRIITVTAEATYTATFEEAVGIENIDILDNLTIYPNPTKGILNFNMEVEKIEVMDMMGKMVMQFCNVSEINIATLPKGVYCLKLSYNGKIIVHKIIKE